MSHSYYQPDHFHDACGTGFIADVSGKPSRRVVRFALQALRQLSHRGARSADKKTGDGSGIMTDLPRDYFANLLQTDFGIYLRDDEILTAAMIFTTPAEKDKLVAALEKSAPELGFSPVAVRDVPVNPDALGELARSTAPLIVQVFFATTEDQERSVENRAFLLRRRSEQMLARDGMESFICSLSSKTIVYKGLMTSHQLESFYSDLAQPEYRARVAIFHERFSTNTRSTWSMAQPFRMLAHNGEINTIKGNRLWMTSREAELSSDYWGEDLPDLIPIVSDRGSDSYSLDNALEFLSHSGRDMFHSIMMLIPEPYAKNPHMPQELKDFYIYHENYIEPWDGPAALVFTDGDYVGAKLDRNGLRPLRYTLTRDGLVIMASEAGVIPVQEDNLLLHHHMASGEIFAVALDGSGMIQHQDIVKRIISETNYSALLRDNFQVIERGSPEEEFGNFAIPEGGFDQRIRHALGWNEEDMTRYLVPMAQSGREPIGSMGDDSPPAFFSRQDRRIYDYFKQAFAQVTNPPIDPIREQFVTALFKYLGSEENLLSNRPKFHGAMRIESPVLSPRDVRILQENHHWFPHTKVMCHLHIEEDFETALENLQKRCEQAVLDGNKIIFISDEDIREELLPIPMPIVVSTVHHYLSRKKLRSRVSLIALTGDVLEDHHVAVLIGMGASGVYPYMAYELIREHFAGSNWPEMMSNYRYALEKGLLKIMSKMGISTLTSYHGSMLFHAIGLSNELIEKHFPSIRCATGGVSLPHFRRKLLERNAMAFNAENPSFENRGFFQYRKSGEFHGFAPDYFRRIQKQAEAQPGETPDLLMIYLRDLLDFKKPKHRLPLDQVETEAGIIRRFGSGGISYGAISEEVHRMLARGMHMAGARSNTGEGGEQYDRFATSNPDKSENSYTKQVASGRFGVSIDYLAAAREIQIKMAQGAKPGEGGQLPGQKVSVSIATARHSTPGVPLISPPPHHDIYSIEDIAQLIYDLKQANPRAQIAVKLVAQPGVGTIACGVAKAGADVILISGGDGGTGASPLGSLKHTGFPWEIGLSETHAALLENGLRSRVTLRTDGGLKNGRDIVIAAMLGAEEYDFGTSLLVALGCVMARRCHLNNCPAGIATQDEKYKKKFRGQPENIVNYLNSVATEVQEILSALGLASLSDAVGRADLLRLHNRHREYVKKYTINVDVMLKPGKRRKSPLDSDLKLVPRDSREARHLDDVVLEEVHQAIMTHGQAVVKRTIKNTDRSVATRVAGELAFLYGRGNFHGHIQYRLNGYAGQSLGAFLCDGLEIQLRGVANDFVGKGMSGGIVSVRMPREIREQGTAHTILGNVALYGATGGSLFVAGRAGERFAVRNSGASAVVEGVGNHCCEYMTRGTVIVLGSTGVNFGAGMTGGVAYVYGGGDELQSNLNADYIRTEALTAADESTLYDLLRRHRFATGSTRAEMILADWEQFLPQFTKLVPIAFDIIDFREIYNQQVALRMGVMLNE
jgi:glutamate synthase (ferredoxin)